MTYILTNALPILMATVASLLFGLGWAKAFGARDGAGRPSAGFAIAAVAAEFWLASILAGALILAPRQAGAWTMAIGSAVVIWIGFVLPALVVALGYRRLGVRAVLFDAGHWLGAMVVQAIVLHAAGLTPPPGAA